jgi:hypothetical protein
MRRLETRVRLGRLRDQHLRAAGDVNYGSFAFDEPTEAEIERRRRLADG